MDIKIAIAAIATVAKWEIIAAMPPAPVTVRVVDLPRSSAPMRVWGPRCSYAATHEAYL